MLGGSLLRGRGERERTCREVEQLFLGAMEGWCHLRIAESATRYIIQCKHDKRDVTFTILTHNCQTVDIAVRKSRRVVLMHVGNVAEKNSSPLLEWHYKTKQQLTVYNYYTSIFVQLLLTQGRIYGSCMLYKLLEAGSSGHSHITVILNREERRSTFNHFIHEPLHDSMFH